MNKKDTLTLKGFTLLELLVVISIVGLLIALGTVSYSTAQKKSRDAKRKGDIKSLQNAAEEYFAQNGSYPRNWAQLGDMIQGDYYGIPKDPKTGSNYDFGFDNVLPYGEGYCVCAFLEISDSGNAYGRNGITCCFDPSETCPGKSEKKDYFCAENLQ